MGPVRSRRLETLVARNRKRHPRENCPQHTAAASVGMMLIFAVSYSFYHFPLTCPIFSSCRQIDWLILSDDRTIPPLHQAVKLGGKNRTHGTGRHPALVHSTLGEVRLSVVRVGLRARDGAGLPCLTSGTAITR